MNVGGWNTSIRPLVIAEIGNNHEGDMETARQLVVQAAAVGAGAVKFQTFKTEFFVNRRDTERYERMRKFELSEQQFWELRDLAREHGLLFISTPLDVPSARFLAPLVDAYKIASGDNDFYPLLENVAVARKPVIISTGVSDLQQVRRSRQFMCQQALMRGFDPQLGILHCVSNYPTKPENANLAAIHTLKREFDCAIGYSDHTIGVEACVLAVAAGAEIIEKHFTLDKNYSDFRDHQLSADPGEMKRLVEQVDAARVLLGSAGKRVLDTEADMFRLIRRSITASRDLPAGHRLEPEDLIWLRPADGLPPGNEEKLLGLTLRHSVAVGQPIRQVDVA